MILFSSAASVALICIMLALHVLSVFLRGGWQSAVNIVNIVLHAALLLPLMLDSVPIDEAVLAYMTSVFVYTLVRFISHGKEGKR